MSDYRPTKTFNSWMSTRTGSSCGTEAAAQPNYSTGLGFVGVGGATGFVGLERGGGITDYQELDPYLGIYSATIKIDEKDLRTMAGLLRGTVGVEHTVDFFVGYVNFKQASGSYVLDSMAAQTNIHVEKTSFFTASVQGENAYTFLSYVNLRLVTVYQSDVDFANGDSDYEESQRTQRQSTAGHADYVQVTFTLNDDKYSPNRNTGLIPLNSVRAGQGTFASNTDMIHKCLEYDGVRGYPSPASWRGDFDDKIGQTCGPQAQMCQNPYNIPDQFAVINIPLGIEYFDSASSAMDHNVFVHMVISAFDDDAYNAYEQSGGYWYNITEDYVYNEESPVYEDWFYTSVYYDEGDAPNKGGDPFQMKTTLSASIPIVEGGINIFCDMYQAKTDLKDVADMDIVVGTGTASEWSRLQILENVASSPIWNREQFPYIESDSIEEGLMTLVVKGSSDYFSSGSNPGRANVQLVLEDVVTIHFMDMAGVQSGPSGLLDYIQSLFEMGPDDNSWSFGLKTDGYYLNGAFYFTVDRAAQRAYLEPTDALLEVCPFSPPRPAGGIPQVTCVTRRDIRYRQFPWRTGGLSTAMEICAGDGVCPTLSSSTESDFMATVLGDSQYSRQLAVDFAEAVDSNYGLNGRYIRAFWVNPGYEWTPTQTNNANPFTVSQKFFLFALISLDEGLVSNNGESIPGGPGPNLGRRRMLLQDKGLTSGQSSNVGGSKFEFAVTPKKMLAAAYGVPQDRVASFKVTLQLTDEEACQDMEKLGDSARATLDDYLSQAASPHFPVQVSNIVVDPGSVKCTRRSLRSLLDFSDASAVIDMIVIFKEGTVSTISVIKLATMAGIKSVKPLDVSPKVSTPVDYTPPADNTKTVNPSDNTNAKDDSDKTGMIVGIVVGGVAFIAIVVGLIVLKSRKIEKPVVAVQSINVADLKAQLGPDV
jgi:hypothetical protein